MAIFDEMASEVLPADSEADLTTAETSETDEAASELQPHTPESTHKIIAGESADDREEGFIAGVLSKPVKDVATLPDDLREGGAIGPETSGRTKPAPFVAQQNTSDGVELSPQETPLPIRVAATDRKGLGGTPRPESTTSVAGAGMPPRVPSQLVDFRSAETALISTPEPGEMVPDPQTTKAQRHDQVAQGGQDIKRRDAGTRPEEYAAPTEGNKDIEVRAEPHMPSGAAKSRGDVPAGSQTVAAPQLLTSTMSALGDSGASTKMTRFETISPSATAHTVISATIPSEQAAAPGVVTRTELPPLRQALVRSTGPSEAHSLAIAFGSEEAPPPLAQSVSALAPETVAQSQFRASGVALPTPQVIVRQVLEALGSSGRDLIEITLDPPELGRIRMAMAETAGSISVTIQADASATSDLLRRHQDMLRQDLLAQGYKDVSFTFEQNAFGGQGQDSPEINDAPTGEAPEMRTVSETRLTLSSAGVDIRL
ncbi:flagellar hook-length control protein FliK [Shimia aestuarii]|nr:flagellar hook-length control protein FliK [Shimia aestuarii]